MKGTGHTISKFTTNNAQLIIITIPLFQHKPTRQEEFNINCHQRSALLSVKVATLKLITINTGKLIFPPFSTDCPVDIRSAIFVKKHIHKKAWLQYLTVSIYFALTAWIDTACTKSM